jgi:hypothetical protein
MADNKPIYRVTIGGKGTSGTEIDRIAPGSKHHRKTDKASVLRHRDAIELFRKLKSDGKGFEGVYLFNFLDSARTFSVLYLQYVARSVQDNLDRVLQYGAGT